MCKSYSQTPGTCVFFLTFSFDADKQQGFSFMRCDFYVSIQCDSDAILIRFRDAIVNTFLFNVNLVQLPSSIFLHMLEMPYPATSMQICLPATSIQICLCVIFYVNSYLRMLLTHRIKIAPHR